MRKPSEPRWKWNQAEEASMYGNAVFETAL